jgi:glutamate racemase
MHPPTYPLSKHQPIAVFDSGLGSYSIVQALQKEMPYEHIVFLADRASFPYGTMAVPDLLKNIQSRIDWLEKTYSPKCIIVASNTPSVTVFEMLKTNSALSFPVLPPLDEALEKSHLGGIAILGTQNLVQSEYVRTRKHTLEANGKRVVLIDAGALIDTVESGQFLDYEAIIPLINDVLLDTFLGHSVDVATLSSTHLPFLKPALQGCFPDIQFLDPAESISSDIHQTLLHHGLAQNDPTSGCTFTPITTENPSKGFSRDQLVHTFSLMGIAMDIQAKTIL